MSEEVKTIWVTEIRKLLTGQLEACKGIGLVLCLFGKKYMMHSDDRFNTDALNACPCYVEASQQRAPDQFTSDTSSTNRYEYTHDHIYTFILELILKHEIKHILRLVKNEHGNLRSGGVEKQKTEEERGKELENILEPGTTQRVKGE